MKQKNTVFLPVIANTLGAVLAGKIGLQIKIDPDAKTAKTNGEYVWIPAFVAEGSEDDETIMRAFLAHEIVGHCRHTDFTVGDDKKVLLHSITNILEDARIEKAAWAIFPKVKTLLSNGVDALNRRDFFGKEVPDDKVHPGSIITRLLLRTLRADFLGQNLDHAGINKYATRMFGRDVVEDILELAFRGANSSTTEDVFLNAQEIIKILELEEERRKQEDQNQQDQDQQQGQGQGGADVITKALNATKDEIGKTDLSEGAENLVVANDRKSQDLSSNDNITKKVLKGVASEKYTPSLVSLTSSQQLSGKLEQLLQAKSERRDRVSDTGRLDGRRLTQAMTGDPMCFKQRGKEAEGLSTAISLLLDQSGSMGNIMEVAKDACFALSTALAKFTGAGVAFELASFNGSMTVIKAWETTWASRKDHFAGIKPTGGTHFQSTLLEASKGLIQRREERKIAFFITDGDIGVDSMLCFDTLRKEGIEIRCVLIGAYTSPEVLFTKAGIKHWAIAIKPDEITKAIFSALSDAF